MKFTWMFLSTLLIAVVAAPCVHAQTEASNAIELLERACKAVWKTGTTFQIDRCTRRAMAALGDENRLRDNELKRMLMQSDRDLVVCSDKLEKLEDEASGADGDVPRTARRKP